MLTPTGASLFPDRQELCFSEVRKEKRRNGQYIGCRASFQKELNVRVMRAPTGLNGPDQPPLEPPPLLPVDLAAPFKLRPVVHSLLELSYRYAGLQSCL